MIRKSALAIATALFTAGAVSSEPQIYRSTEYGFRLQPPTFPVENAFGISATPVTFQGPVKDGGAATCNVQVQNVNFTPAQYRELSLNQFKAMGWSVDSEESRQVSDKDATIWYYGGPGIKGIALAVFAGSRVYLTSCLAPEATYADEKARFLATINSFALE